MAADQPTLRLDLTYSELEALSWAVWFSAPAAMTTHWTELESVEKKLLAKRRQSRQPRAAQPASLDQPQPQLGSDDQ